MENRYIKEKAKDTANVLARKCGVDFQTAFNITERVWEEARSAVLRVVSVEDWGKLTFSEKACVCQEVIKGLLDKKRLLGFLNGERSSIL